MTSSGSWQHPTMGTSAVPQQKRPRGRPRKVVDPTTTSPADRPQKRRRGRPRKVLVPSTGAGCRAVQGNTHEEVAFGFESGIEVTQGRVLSESGMPTYRSQHVPASVRETRVSHGDQQSQERYKQTIRPFGAVEPSNPITDSPYAIDLMSRFPGISRFPGFQLYVQMLEIARLSSLHTLAMSLRNAPLQQPASNTVLSWPTETIPVVSASALHHPNPTEPHSQVREVIGGMEHNRGISPLPVVQQHLPMSLPNPCWLPERFPPTVSSSALRQPVPTEPSNQSYRYTSSVPTVSASASQHHILIEPSNQSYRNTSSVPTVSASALYRPIPTEPSNESYRNTSSVPTVSASVTLQHPILTNPSNQSYRNPWSHQEWF